MTEPTAGAVPDDFNLDDWIDGTCGLTRIAKIYQKGHLFAEVDRLERELSFAKKIRKEDRGLDDKSPEQLQRELDSVYEELASSALTVHVQDRTDERRRAIRERLKKQGLKVDEDDDLDTIILHVIADAIVKVETANGKVKNLPDGFPVEKLRALRDRLGDAALFDVKAAFNKVTMEAPSVAAPLSRRSSSNPGGVT